MSDVVSTIIPVFNGEAFLAEAVASIRAQVRPPDEIIVVDDGSSDASASIAGDLGGELRVVRHASNQGVAAALNTGLGEARGEFITFLDADDLWSPEKLALQLRIARDASVDVVVGQTQKMQLVGSADGRRFEPWAEPQLALTLCSSLMHREAFDRIGWFDTSLVQSMDWDWFMRAREQGVAIKVHPEVVLYYRRHGGNMTENPDGNRYTLQMLRQSLLRRRQASPGGAESLSALGPD